MGEAAQGVTLIVENGRRVIDVSVYHPFYGGLKGNLDLATKEEVATFTSII